MEVAVDTRGGFAQDEAESFQQQSPSQQPRDKLRTVSQ